MCTAPIVMQIGATAMKLVLDTAVTAKSFCGIIQMHSFTFIDPTETSCDSSGLDDGWCDSVNNNPKCMFDGGDCCSGEDFWCSHCDGDSCNCHETGEPLCYGT